MRERAILREILDIFTSPKSFIIHTPSGSISLDSPRVSIRQSSDYIEFMVHNEDDTRDMITLPMSVEGIEQCRLLAYQLQSFEIGVMTPYRVESVRFTHNTNSYISILVDVAFQRLPPYHSTLKSWLSNTLNSDNSDSDADNLNLNLKIDELYRAINLLDRTLRQLNIHFKGSRGLTPESILVGDDGLLYPFRYTNMRSGSTPHNKKRECDTLREWVESESGIKEGDNERGIVLKRSTSTGSQTDLPTNSYPTHHPEPFEGHLSTGILNEERIIIEGPNGYGFADADNNIIVEPNYRSAQNYREGRAMVQSEHGWGLLNLDGFEVIPSIYESIGYNAESGISCVKQGDKWSYFSYMGEQLTPFNIDYPNEEITLEEIVSTLVKSPQPQEA